MKPNPFKTLALSTAISALLAGGAMAQQTAPGVAVLNTISLTYQSGANTPAVTLPPVASHTAEFKVDRKIDLLVTTVTTDGLRTAVPGETPVVIPFFVRNLGNATEGYIVTVDDGGTIDAAPGLQRVTSAPASGEYGIVLAATYDPNTFNAASATYYTPGAAAFDIDPNLAETGGYYVLIVANIPITSLNGQFDEFTVTVATADEPGSATARTAETRSANPLDVNIVFAETESVSAQTGGASLDPALNGQVIADTRLRIDAPEITASKTVEVIDENLASSNYSCEAASGSPVVNSTTPAFLPGGCILYTIAVANSSSTATTATSIAISDTVPEELEIRDVSNFVFTGTGTPATQPSASGQNVTGTVATLEPGATATFTIRAEIK